ncbi:MAG TPA: hypothetical protein VNI57_06215, partial [Candidatus Saccharimonadales bacterium]|nr:hypothetical protein [Candidatus Saccharimonadales bacterium]
MKAGAALLLLAVSLAACGGDYNPSAGSGRRAALMAAVYDLEADYPSLELPSLSATGLSLIAEIRFDPQPAGAPPGSVTGSVTIREARAGGVVRTFDPNAPIPVSGTLQNRQLDLYPFGPVTVGQQALFVELHGTLSSDSRRFTGLATFSNLAEQGTWSGVKQRRYLITASDFGVQGTATIVTVRFDTQFEVRRDAELVSGDPVAAASGGLPFVVNRLFFDNVQVLDPDDSFKTALQFSTGNGSNPHDALSPAAGKIYVTRYEPAFDDVLIADPGTGKLLGSIPLSGFATNSSGTARPDRLVEAGGAV